MSQTPGPEYVSYSQLSDLPACSFDFGNDGFAASCNYGGELLQMTAPSDDHGLVYARGDFEYSLYLALARGQKEKGGKSAFGLKVAPSDELAKHGEGPRFRPCCMVERGCFNYRWPFNEFCLHVDTPKPRPTSTPPTSTASSPGAPDVTSNKQKIAASPVGTFSLASYVRDGVLYQILRLSPTLQPGVAKTAELVLTVEPPMRLQSFLRLNQPDSKETEVGLKACEKHDACVSGGLPVTKDRGPVSDMHWRADLFRLESGRAMPIKLARLGKEKEKKDHVFKIGDDFDSLPRFQADLKSLDTNAHHIFVASFRLFEDSKTQPLTASLPPQTCLSPQSISDFVRNGEADAPGTAPLWQATFNERQESMDCVSELCEGSVVGRCLEKILRVDLVPATMPQSNQKHFTLVSNMFLKATVDLKSMFWKVRFLVKVDHLLCRRFKDHPLATAFQCQREHNTCMSESRTVEKYYTGQDQDMITAETTIRRIRYVIGEIATYIVRALLRPAPSPILLPEVHYGDPSHYYAMITLCYLVKHYPNAKWAWQDELSTTGKRWGLGILGDRLPRRKDNHLLCSNNMLTRVKYSMLEWLHYESISRLQHESRQTAEVRVIPSEWQASESRVKKAQATAKTELVHRIASAHVDSYRPDDEIADRLAFLAEELLGAEHSTARHVTERIARRVEEREYTREISLCRSNRASGGTDDGPWEVHALCHHSRLVVAHKRLCAAMTSDAREEAEMEVEHYRKKFYPFLTSEASLMPCWERNNSSARRGFLRSEATAVLASTILDIFEKDIEYHQHGNTESREPILSEPPPTAPSIALYGGSEAGGDAHTHHDNISVLADMRGHFRSRRGNTSSMRHLRRTGERANVEAILIRQLETLEKLANARGVERQINYLEFRPPCRYHPVEFFNSLDDAPELYSNEGIHHRESTIPVVIRETLARQTPPAVPPPSKTSGAVTTSEPLDSLEELLNKSEEETTNRLRELLVGRVKGSRPVDVADGDLWRLDVLEAAKLLRQLAVIDLKTPESLETFTPKPIREAHIVRVVSDSLIDQEVRHRFLLALTPYELPAGLLRLLVYVLHPEMLECFKNHRIQVSRFGVSSRQDTLTMHITLRSWSTRPYTGRPANTPPVYSPWFATKEDDKIHLPVNLRHHAEALGRFPKDLQLHVSSIGMSTNAFGDFSKCTIISSLLSQEQIDVKLGPLAQQIWDNFTHQPQTGRFLVFSLVLGMLTQAIVTHYTVLVNDFLKQTQLGDERLPSYLRDPEKLQDRDADAELRFTLWSLEALAKLNNTVSTSVTTLQEALAEITYACQINSPFAASSTGMLNVGGSKLRSAELESAIHTYLSPLERAYSDLAALQTKLSRKVDLSTRYSNSLSAILALRASRDSYNQNNTIQKLTYLTIGCLPVGLTAALFAVPTEQDVIMGHTGKGWFIGTVMISFAIIFAVAYWLDWLLGVLRMAKDDPRGLAARFTRKKKGGAVVTGRTFLGP
ncbi:hypothetical protein QBC37DRAFT_322240 [Rhypophila decipiens]|uniref:Uncharacterized protein n=1 Tax=Rhypophila decipiens TaxID=261697 RepID=A0AAN6Y196_9PEZI|nr:hypothetical protein QBC37DRAFT_322240 [Rhypophila decipiens]